MIAFRNVPDKQIYIAENLEVSQDWGDKELQGNWLFIPYTSNEEEVEELLTKYDCRRVCENPQIYVTDGSCTRGYVGYVDDFFS